MLGINYQIVTQEEYKSLLITAKLLKRLCEEVPDPLKSIEIYGASCDLDHLIPDFKKVGGKINFVSVYEEGGTGYGY